MCHEVLIVFICEAQHVFKNKSYSGSKKNNNLRNKILKVKPTDEMSCLRITLPEGKNFFTFIRSEKYDSQA